MPRNKRSKHNKVTTEGDKEKMKEAICKHEESALYQLYKPQLKDDITVKLRIGGSKNIDESDSKYSLCVFFQYSVERFNETTSKSASKQSLQWNEYLTFHIDKLHLQDSDITCSKLVFKLKKHDPTKYSECTQECYLRDILMNKKVIFKNAQKEITVFITKVELMEYENKESQTEWCMGKYSAFKTKKSPGVTSVQFGSKTWAYNSVSSQTNITMIKSMNRFQLYVPVVNAVALTVNVKSSGIPFTYLSPGKLELEIIKSPYSNMLTTIGLTSSKCNITKKTYLNRNWQGQSLIVACLTYTDDQWKFQKNWECVFMKTGENVIKFDNGPAFKVTITECRSEKIQQETQELEERKMIFVHPKTQAAEESEKIQQETQELEKRNTKYQLYISIGKDVLNLEVMSTNTNPFNYFNCGILEISFKNEIIMTISLTSPKCCAKKRILRNNWKGDLAICLKYTDQEWKYQEQKKRYCMTRGTTVLPLYFDMPYDTEKGVQFTITINITKWTTDVEYQTSPRLCNAESTFVLERKKFVSNVLQHKYGFGKKRMWRFVRGLPVLMDKNDGIMTGSGIASALNLADEPGQKIANDGEDDRIPAPEKEMAANPERIEAGGDLLPALNLAEKTNQTVMDGGGDDGIFPAEGESADPLEWNEEGCDLLTALNLAEKADQTVTDGGGDDEIFPAEGERVDPLEVPTIAVIGSGGGMRAVIGMGGAMTGLQKHGILDITMFTAGLSGSAWYLLALYADDSDGLDPVKVNKHIAENLSSFKSVCMAWNLLKFFFKRIIGDHGKYFSATNIFGKMIGRLLLRKGQHTWSEQTMKIEQMKLPMPLVAALHVRDETTIEEHHEWVEFTPYKVTIEEYGTSINMADFGSEFADGRLTKKNREPPIHYLQGICGSAYAIVREYRHKVCDRVQSVFHYGLIILRSNILECNCILWGQNVGQIVLMSNILGFECYLILGFVRYSYWNLFRYPRDFIWKMFNIFDALFIAKVPNFIRGTQLRRIDDVNDTIDIDKEYMMLVDAGLSFNSPYPLVLHPNREVDVIISFDWSDRGEDAEWPFGELVKAIDWARKRNCLFPCICEELDEIREQWKTIKKEMYIFKGFGAPTIIHFVMINIENGFRILPEYSTLKFGYTTDEFERFNSLVQRIVERNMNEIQECIGRATYMRKFKNVMRQLLENIQMVE